MSRVSVLFCFFPLFGPNCGLLVNTKKLTSGRTLVQWCAPCFICRWVVGSDWDKWIRENKKIQLGRVLGTTEEEWTVQSLDEHNAYLPDGIWVRGSEKQPGSQEPFLRASCVHVVLSVRPYVPGVTSALWYLKASDRSGEWDQIESWVFLILLLFSVALQNKI